MPTTSMTMKGMLLSVPMASSFTMAANWAALLKLGRMRGSGTATRAGVSSIVLRVARPWLVVKLNRA